MSNIPISLDKPVQTGGTPETYLRQRDFDALIYKKGYPVYIDYLMPCPCKEEGVNAPRLTCKNCFGTGFILSERKQTIVMLASMNFPTEYKDWSIENVGTASITTLSSCYINFMDRVVLYEEHSMYSELIYPIELESGEVIAFCAYPPTEILDMKLFQGDTEKLLDIPNLSDITIDGEGKLILTNIKDLLYKRADYIHNAKTGISIRYLYHPSYHIIDVTRNLIVSPTDTPTDGLGKKGQRVQFPYHAVGRMTHLVLERGNLMRLPDGYNSNVTGQDTTMLDQMNNKDIDEKFCDTEEK